MKVFIMGMHRSGTSLVTGLLHRCGLYLGNNLLMGAKDNPKGHYEDRRFININNNILRANGGSWRNPPIAVNWGGMKPSMQNFLKGWPDDKIVGWKDPRTCITFPLWHHLIHPEPIKVVLVHRSCIEISQSLKARNGMPLAAGRNLCQRYKKASWDSVKGKPGVNFFHTLFSAYFGNWELELEAVLDFLGLEMPADKSKLQKFITPSLWRNRF